MKIEQGEVRPAVDVAAIAIECRKALVALDAAEHDVDRRRLTMGQVLMRARKGWPRRGPKAAGWGQFLSRDVGIDQQRAWELMKYAGYVEENISPDSGETLPTLAEAGIDRKPRKSATTEDVEPMPADERAALVAKLDVEAEERRQAALAPLRMESRNEAATRVLTTVENCIAQLNSMHADGARLSDCTTSPNDFEIIKSRFHTLFSMVEEELARVGVDVVRPATSPKAQLSLVPQGAK